MNQGQPETRKQANRPGMNFKPGNKVRVKKNSYTAFNGQEGYFIKYTGTHNKHGQLCEIDFPNDCVCELPVETLEEQ